MVILSKALALDSVIIFSLALKSRALKLALPFVVLLLETLVATMSKTSSVYLYVSVGTSSTLPKSLRRPVIGSIAASNFLNTVSLSVADFAPVSLAISSTASNVFC